MKTILEKISKWVTKEEVTSFLHTFVTDLLWEVGVSAAVGHIVTNGDFSKTALLALGYAVLRTFTRDLRDFLRKKLQKATT